jgi:hypothetical protein
MSVGETDADVRWREWQARGAASDLRTATATRRFLLVGAAALAVWVLVQLV